MDEKQHQFYKIVTYIAESYFDDFLNVLLENNINKIGNYVNCISWSPVTSTWTSVEGAHPCIGEVGTTSIEKENKIEFLCEEHEVKRVTNIINKYHPYEEVEIDIYPIFIPANFSK